MIASPPLDLSLRRAVGADARSLGVLGTQVLLDTCAPQGIPELARLNVLGRFTGQGVGKGLLRESECCTAA